MTPDDPFAPPQPDTHTPKHGNLPTAHFDLRGICWYAEPKQI